MPLRLCVLAVSALLASALLTGCSLTNTAAPSSQSGTSITGNLHGGQQPIIGGHIYLFAAGASGYSDGTSHPSFPLLSDTGFSDSLGAYVPSDAQGNFNITGRYSCATGDQVYLYAKGGNGGAGNNSAIGLMALLGTCPGSGNFAITTPFLYVSETSTVAAAYAMAGFAVNPNHVSSSGTTQAKLGIANAFKNAPNLVSLATGIPFTTLPTNASGLVPRTKINTLSNILAACVNTSGPTGNYPSGANACDTLFNNATSNGIVSGGTLPTDTAAAILNIAHHPASNISTLFGLQAGVAAPFAPALSTTPNDFTVTVRFSNIAFGQQAVAIDSSGNAWVSTNSNTLYKFASDGTLAAGAPYFSGGIAPKNIAVDSSDNLWVSIYGNTNTNARIAKFGPTGVAAVGSPYTVTGLVYPLGIAIDPNGYVWTENTQGLNNYMYKLDSSAVPTGGSPFAYNDTSNLYYVAIDTSGHAWFTNDGAKSLVELNTTDGTMVTGSPFTVSGSGTVDSLAIDHGGNIWLTDVAPQIHKITGTNVSGFAIAAPGSPFSGGGISDPRHLVIDGDGNVWVPNYGTRSVTELANDGTILSGTTGYQGEGFMYQDTAAAVDPSGNVWVTNDGTPYDIDLILGVAAPVVTPIAAAVATNTLGTRP